MSNVIAGTPAGAGSRNGPARPAHCRERTPTAVSAADATAQGRARDGAPAVSPAGQEAAGPPAGGSGGAGGHAGRVTIRCLHGRQPEHRARQIVADVLAGAGLAGELPDAELAVSELVTNARQHAPGPYELRIYVDPAAVKIAVMDGGADHIDVARKLVRAAAGLASGGESGRGLQIVTGLFPGSWGAEPAVACTGLAPAKQVWIMLPRPAQAVSQCHRVLKGGR
jgi:hypothetical protein